MGVLRTVSTQPWLPGRHREGGPVLQDEVDLPHEGRRRAGAEEAVVELEPDREDEEDGEDELHGREEAPRPAPFAEEEVVD